MQRPVDDVGEQLISERFYDRGDRQDNLPRTDRGNEPGAAENSQPAQADSWPGRGEAVVNCPRNGVTDDERGHHIGD
jgi:hypothetical protein